MTDKNREIAEKIWIERCSRKEIESALDEAEKRGMERAATIAERCACTCRPPIQHTKAVWACEDDPAYEISDKIRAAAKRGEG